MANTTCTITATIDNLKLDDEILVKLKSTAGVSSVAENPDSNAVDFCITSNTLAEAKAVIGNVAHLIPGVPIKWSAVESS